MSFYKKRQLLGLLIIIGLLMVLLAMGLPGLHLKAGINLYADQTAENVDTVSERGELDYTNWDTFIRVFSIIVNILLGIYIVVSLFSKKGRKQLLATLGVFVLLILLMFIVSALFSPVELAEEMFPSQIEEGEMEEIEEELGIPVEFDPTPKPWLLTIVLIVGAILLAGVVFFSLNTFSRQKSLDASQFTEIAKQAQSALEEIEAAKFSFNDIIIRCYAEMSLAIQTEKGIQRAKEMTTLEFEQELISSGFPARPVHELTRLFEQVRYGHREIGEIEKQKAVESLGDIIAFCKEPA
jgi:hypothetical protein